MINRNRRSFQTFLKLGGKLPEVVKQPGSGSPLSRSELGGELPRPLRYGFQVSL